MLGFKEMLIVAARQLQAQVQLHGEGAGGWVCSAVHLGMRMTSSHVAALVEQARVLSSSTRQESAILSG
jgi:hypothetical protein